MDVVSVNLSFKSTCFQPDVSEHLKSNVVFTIFIVSDGKWETLVRTQEIHQFKLPSLCTTSFHLNRPKLGSLSLAKKVSREEDFDTLY